MGHKVAVPAESIRRLASIGTRKWTQIEDNGRPATARALRRACAAAYDAAGGKPGDLVSIEARYASSLVVHCRDGEYQPGVVKMLRHQHYW